MATVTSFHAENCYHLVSEYEASEASGQRQFLICRL